MSNVIHVFSFNGAPPEDARPISGRTSLVVVLPCKQGGWVAIEENSESGSGILGWSLPKWEAIRIALDYVRTWNAEMRIVNDRRRLDE